MRGSTWGFPQQCYAEQKQPLQCEYTTRQAMHERMHIQSTTKECLRDENVELDDPIKKYLATSKK